MYKASSMEKAALKLLMNNAAKGAAKGKAGRLLDAVRDAFGRGKTAVTDAFNSASDSTGALFSRNLKKLNKLEKDTLANGGGWMHAEDQAAFDAAREALAPEVRRLGRNVLLGTGAGIGTTGAGLATYAALKEPENDNVFDRIKNLV